jgi:hypothetical protein
MVIRNRRPKIEEILATGDKKKDRRKKPLPMAKMDRHSEDEAPLFEIY